jgi:dephospho-CoA kinase
MPEQLKSLAKKKIAITGGVAAGKTSVSRLLQRWGAHTVSADAIVHQLLASDRELMRRVATLLGEGVVVEGQLDRRAIAERVFAHPPLLRSLEEILHPLVFEEIERLYAVFVAQGGGCFVVEVPLLFDPKRCAFFDEIVAVTAPDDLCRERALRAGMAYIDERQEQRRARGQGRIDHTIVNAGSPEELEQHVLDWLQGLE